MRKAPNDEAAVIFWGICYGTHDKDGYRTVPSYRVRKRLAKQLGTPMDLTYWRKLAASEPKAEGR